MLYLEKEIGLLTESEHLEIDFILENECLTLDFIQIICLLESLPIVHEPLNSIEEDYQFMLGLDRDFYVDVQKIQKQKHVKIEALK